MNNFSDFRYLDTHLHDRQSTLPKNDIFYVINSIFPDDYVTIKQTYKNQINILPCWGIHPRASCHISAGQVKDLYPPDYKAPFIGECGLDFHWITDRNTWNNQRDVFKEVLKLCEEHQKIPCIHTKGAEAEIPEILSRYSLPGILIHWYSGPKNILQKYCSLDCYFTIGPDIINTQKNGLDGIKNTLYNTAPRDRLLAETDMPGAYEWVTGNSETDEDIKIIYKELALCMNINLTELQVLLRNNFSNLLSVKN